VPDDGVTRKGVSRFHAKPSPGLFPQEGEFAPPRRQGRRRLIKFASGETPPIAMKPACRPLDVAVCPNRLDAGASISSERLPEAIADIGVASAGKVTERDLAQKTRLELVAPLHKKHASAGVRRHRENEPCLRAQALEPGWQWVGRPGAGDDDIALGQRNRRPVAVDNGDLRPGGERRSRAFRQRFINLNRFEIFPIGPTSSARTAE
jgi:hypothetical protein